MKIVILCKRAPQGRDLWERPYGRFFHLAQGLAQRGHEVHLVLLSYQGGKQFEETRDGINWHSINLLPDPSRYYRMSFSLVRKIDADWVVGFSDTYFGICAQNIAGRLGAKSLIDAYDNYESYLPWALPLHWLWRAALSGATVVTAAGPGLLDRMAANRPDGINVVVEMAADPIFTPGERFQARQSLELPAKKQLVAYCGSLHHTRGIDQLLAVMNQMSVTQPEVGWLFSGRNLSGVQLPGDSYRLGYVSDTQVVDVIRSADVVLALNTPGEFGDYSYPVKIYEANAVGVPVIALSTDSVEFVMRSRPEGLVVSGSTEALAEKISKALTLDSIPQAQSPGWAGSVDRLESCLSAS